VVGEAGGCSGGCGFVYALCRAFSLAGPRWSPRKKGWAEDCFDRADGEKSICRTRVQSNAEGVAQSSEGVRVPMWALLPIVSCQGYLGRIGCVQVEPYEEQIS
jgi:hypothetical protein